MKCLVTITGTVAILAAALLASGSDAAARGAGRLSIESDSGYGPSKYAHSSQVSPRAIRHAQRTDFGITEYSSSSSARSSVPKR
jgi:hypothetical protein